jgi:LysR family transcriptional regulator, nitrogen assimilation regulatory protein
MEARVLEYFLRTVELGSINRAAAELNLSQPSLSRWLSLLEREVGTPLLIRTRKGIRVTEAGTLLVERSGPVLRQIHLLVDEVGNKAVTRIALGMPVAMQRLITAPFVERLMIATKPVHLRVYEGINNAIRAWMEAGLIDIGVMAFAERAPDRFEVTPLIKEQLLLVGGPRVGLRLDVPVPISDVGNVPIILPGRPNIIRAQVENALQSCGRAYRARLDAETLPLCLELTRHGLGHTVMPYSAVHGQLKAADLTAAPIKDLTITWALYVNRARDHSTAVRGVASALAAFVMERHAAGQWAFATPAKTAPKPTANDERRPRPRAVARKKVPVLATAAKR